MNIQKILLLISLLTFSCKEKDSVVNNETPPSTEPKVTEITIYERVSAVTDTKYLGYGIKSEIELTTPFYDVSQFDSISFSWKSSISPFLDSATISRNNLKVKIVYIDFLYLRPPTSQKQFDVNHTFDTTFTKFVVKNFEIIGKDNVSFAMKIFAGLSSASEKDISRETINLAISDIKIVGYK